VRCSHHRPTGFFRCVRRGEMGKGFFTSEGSASALAKGLSAQGKGPFTTIRTFIPTDIAARSASYAPAAEGDALFIVGEDLSSLGSPVVNSTMVIPW